MFEYKKSINRWFAMALVVISIQVNAAENKSTINQNFEQGISYFKQGNYSAAVKQFEQARKQGNRSAALYYNLGSVYFKLEQYKNAQSYFKVLQKKPKMKSLAEYNLGLIALKQKDRAGAKKYFKTVVKTSQDKKIVYLANQQLQKLTSSKRSKKTTASNKKSSVYLSGSAGYDSNINFSPVGIGTEKSGSFFDALVSADYLLTGNHSNGWGVEGFLYAIRYPGIAQGGFDQDQYAVSVKKTQKLKKWNTHLKLTFDQSTYGSRDYQSIIKLEGRGRRKLSKTDRIYLRYRYEDISSDFFSYTEGWRQKIRSEFRRYNKKNYVQLYYELELNDRNDILPATGNQFSYSPTRHTLRGKYTAKLNAKWDLTGDLAYRKSDYPSTATQSRNDERWKAIASANYRFDKTMKLKMKLEYTDNSSSDNLYVYDRQVIAVNLNKLF